MAFGLGKLAVLESKLDIYEDLSQQMLDKLERAVGTISDNSNKIAIILERHENRLDESERSDQLIIKMIDEIKATEERNHEILHGRIDKLQVEIKAFSKFRWQVGGVLIVGALMIGAGSRIAPLLLTPEPQQVIIERQ